MKNNQPKFVKQYVSGVLDFSSQYGSENPRSVSYSVANIVGEPKIFPGYGDFTQAAVFRTYGPWWGGDHDECCVKRKNTRPPYSCFHGKDYIDLLFNDAVYPWSIAIYETYNPGAVVRILALTQAFPMPGSSWEKEQPVIPLPFSTGCSSWEVLWECESPNQNLPNPTNESRMFAPVLKEIKHPTRIIRLEICSTSLQYYTELDAVELTGTVIYYPSSSVDPPSDLLEQLSISNRNEQKDTDKLPLSENTTEQFVPNHVEALLENGYFDLLPPELMRYIFSFLPLKDLCRCALVCKLFHDLSHDPSQFTSIDLGGCWHLINDDALSSIVSHCNPTLKQNKDDSKPRTKPHVQVADLSWCGGGGILSNTSMIHFIENCGSRSLTHLILASSPAVSDDVLKRIAHYCPNLMHFDIQSCTTAAPEGLRALHNLSKLCTVNFYRTKIDDAGIICIIHSNPNLRHVNLGSCTNIADYDRVVLELSQHCPNLASLDCWRAKTLTSLGLNALTTSCNFIEELDLGWCGGLQSSSGCFQTLALHCSHLTKLYATANRTISDAEIYALARNCLKLQKLDILGTRLVSVTSVTNLLQRCKNLQFLDVSFCFAFTKDIVESLQQQFPNVSIKRSFQEES